MKNMLELPEILTLASQLKMAAAGKTVRRDHKGSLSRRLGLLLSGVPEAVRQNPRLRGDFTIPIKKPPAMQVECTVTLV